MVEIICYEQICSVTPPIENISNTNIWIAYSTTTHNHCLYTSVEIQYRMWQSLLVCGVLCMGIFLNTPKNQYCHRIVRQIIETGWRDDFIPAHRCSWSRRSCTNEHAIYRVYHKNWQTIFNTWHQDHCDYYKTFCMLRADIDGMFPLCCM